jgi:hypothetical protein
MQTYTKQQLCKLLEISPKRLEKLLEVGAPQGKKKNAYDMEAFCRWVIARPKSKTDKSRLQENAQRFLLGLKQTEEKPAEPATVKKPQMPATDKKVGLMPALERARAAELAAYDAHMKIFNEQGITSASALDAWQKTLDILRKCETDFTKVLERRRELIEIKKVQEWIEQKIELVKTIFLNVPAKLAPSLEGLPWHEIQKRLDQELRDAISKLRNID